MDKKSLFCFEKLKDDRQFHVHFAVPINDEILGIIEECRGVDFCYHLTKYCISFDIATMFDIVGVLKALEVQLEDYFRFNKVEK